MDDRPEVAPPTPVPRAKVAPPAAAGLVRPRLLSGLCDVDGSSLVLVTASPGAGKTTLLAQYVRQERGPGHHFVWFRVEGTDTAAGAFASCLGAAVTLALEGRMRAVGGLAAVHALLEGVEERVTVVLDDAHLLPGTEAETALARFLAGLPDGVRVVLATRAHQDFLTSSLRLAGQVLDVTPDDLRFRTWEVEELFRDHYREPLSPEDAAALTLHTEGWAAGLQMFHLATRGRSAEERSAAVASLWGRSRLLRAYLTGNVLARLPEETADFLVRTSALGVLDGTLCDRLLDRSDSHRVLNGLADRHLFTIPYDDEGWRFRYHTVLQTQLEAMLHERLGADGTRAWYRRAAALLEDAGHWPEAYRAYARAEDWGGGARVLQQGGVGGAEAEASLVNVSPALVDDSWLALAEARRHRAAGRLAAAVAAYERAEQGFDDPRMRQSCRQERRVVAAWTFDGGTGSTLADADWAEHLRAALRSDTGRLMRRAANRREPGWQLAAGLAAMLDGHPHRGLRSYRAAADGPPGFTTLAACLAHASTAAILGLPAETDLDALVFETEVAGLPWLTRVARAFRAVSGVRDDDALAAIRAECETDGDEWGLLLLGVFDGVARLWVNDDGSAQLAEVVERAHRLGVHAFAREFDAVRADPLRLTAARKRTGANPLVRVRCFGRYSLQVDGRELGWDRLRPRAQATLRLLSMHAGTPVHEETLVDALWPDLPLASGRHNLQVAVSTLRKLLEPGRSRGQASILQRRGDAYLLALPDDADVDVVTFTGSLRRWRSLRRSSPAEAAGALRTALAAYQGDLLPEDGPAEWVVRTREQLRTEAAESATALAEHELEAGDARAAVEECRRALRIEPLHDSAWRLQIRAYEQLGDVAARERSRRGYSRVLAELGVTPAESA